LQNEGLKEAVMYLVMHSTIIKKTHVFSKPPPLVANALAVFTIARLRSKLVNDQIKQEQHTLVALPTLA
jgi:hypothetical protein